MAEYIERETGKALFDERYDSAFMQMHTRDNKECWNGVCAGVNWGRNTIADAPTADVVEVVRCKDCECFDRDYDDSVIGACSNKRQNIRCNENHFCSYGTPKERGE